MIRDQDKRYAYVLAGENGTLCPWALRRLPPLTKTWHVCYFLKKVLRAVGAPEGYAGSI